MARTKNFDVFVSFRGADIRNGFTHHLSAALRRKGVVSAALRRKGVVAFRDDSKIRKGELLEHELLQAIEGSRVFLVVFSKDYASSTWCLEVLTKIVDWDEQTGRSVLPIFYDVTPSEVRKQSGKFGETFADHEERFKDDLEMVKKWREALKAITNRCGWDVQNKPQHEEIEEIVEEVVNILGHNQILSFEDESFEIYNLSPNGNGFLKSWEKGEILGKGSFGTVYEGFTDDGNFFAVKEVSLLDDGSQGKQSIYQLQQEISLLSQFRHDNIVRYLGTDKDNDKLYIFLELVTKGSLASLYQKYRLRDSQVSAYTRQILSGLKYLHDRNVVHRDIKCGNILVDANGSVKLADFGLAKATKLNDVKSSKGSPYWMAPEVVNLRNGGYGLAADIWSLGCTVLEMLTRQPPYSHLEGMQALFRIGRGQPPPVPESLSTDARDFILKCLQVNPNKRPTAAQLLDHPFVKRPLLSPISPVSPSINLLLS